MTAEPRATVGSIQEIWTETNLQNAHQDKTFASKLPPSDGAASKSQSCNAMRRGFPAAVGLCLQPRGPASKAAATDSRLLHPCCRALCLCKSRPARFLSTDISRDITITTVQPRDLRRLHENVDGGRAALTRSSQDAH